MELNPVENALVELRAKNRRLRESIATAEQLPDGGASQEFSLLISGVVDAPVGGGLSNFFPLLNGEFLRTHPEIADDIRLHSIKVIVV